MCTLKSRTKLWLTTPAISSSTSSSSVNSNSSLPGAQPKSQQSPLTPFPSYCISHPQAFSVGYIFKLHSEFRHFSSCYLWLSLQSELLIIVFLDYCNNLLTNVLAFHFATVFYTQKQERQTSCPCLRLPSGCPLRTHLQVLSWCTSPSSKWAAHLEARLHVLSWCTSLFGLL